MKKILLNTVRKTKNYKKHSALVSDEDYERVCKYNWSVKKCRNTIYVKCNIKGKQIHLHHFIMGFTGIDHIDMNGLNNQKSNLRKATNRENCMNRKSHKNSSSRFKGVCWVESRRRWVAHIKYNNKLIHLGYFAIETEAAKRYNEYAKKYFKEFARLNII